MARLKTAYRNPAKPPVETPTPSVQIGDDQKTQPSASTTINFETDKAEPSVAIVGEAGEPGDAVTEALQKAAEADEASEVLKRQLAHLQASEQAQREFATQVAAQRAA